MRTIIHKNPDQDIARRYKELQSFRKLHGEDEYYRLLREVVKIDPWYLMRVVYDWGWLDEHLTGQEFLGHLSQNWGRDQAILLPRGHGKTLPMAAEVLRFIFNYPNCAILQVTRTDDNAKKFGDFVSSLIFDNEDIQRCFGIAHNEDGFLPSSLSDTSTWSKEKGYVLPKRKPRLDPTLKCISMAAAKAGKHPDWVYIDDPTEAENNNEAGWNDVADVIRGIWMLLPPSGFFIWTGTRWHDSDPIGMAIDGKLKGKQGQFKCLIRSCYVDDDPSKGVIYPHKIRWNMAVPTGYKLESLEDFRKPINEGGYGTFFDAQMRNDPKPLEINDLDINALNVYDKKDLPELGDVATIVAEVDGGGLVLWNSIKEMAEDTGVDLPLEQYVTPRGTGRASKKDRIIAVLQPEMTAGKLYAQEWMIGDKHAREGLGYEIRRIGSARHDDIVDALHKAIEVAKGLAPHEPGEPMPVVVAIDFAWSEKKRSDWTVIIAVGIDHNGSLYIVNYDRFQCSLPSGVFQRILSFYQKLTKSKNEQSTKPFPGAWR